DDQLWIDLYEPTTEADLAVHKKKVEDVRRWFVEAFEGGPSGKLKKYRRILALTGPAGTAKTATVRVLARELGFEIVEWRNSMSERFAGDDDDADDNDYGYGRHGPMDQEALFTKFQAFLTRASSCQSIFSPSPAAPLPTPSSSQSTPTKPPKHIFTPTPKRHIILLEDLPNILHPRTQSQFHAALQGLVDSPVVNGVPVVIIVSDAGVRGEVGDDERIAGGGAGRWGKEVVDIRSVLPAGLLGSAYVTQIGFNPIAPTLLRKALQSLLSLHFSNAQHTKHGQPPKDVVDIIVDSSNGDIRSAIMALQFACIVELPRTDTGASSKKGKGKKVVLEAVTRRESSLALFHLMGKVLYNKRKGDPPSSSASAKDIQREKDLDAAFGDPPTLPVHLSRHDRRTSRVNVDTIYADSPIDSSLFSLYVHQNYTQFCNEIEECEEVSEWLSWVDSSGGEAWHQTNPHQFHLLTLGTLHSLPSPVERRSQKFFKPEFFEVLKREREAGDGIEDVRRWLGGGEVDLGMEVGRGWSRAEVAIELGGWLKAKDRLGSSRSSNLLPPRTHRLFSNLTFSRTGSSGALLGERDEVDTMGGDELSVNVAALRTEIGDGREKDVSAETSGGWLESDDIEEF
ncbi:hypothetical protein PILCRDRAFT_64773, partial [Piloderma croceum F 1598]